MSVLPRTAKGTWLLAAATWVGLCVIAWQLLPMRPRATWRLPEATDPIAFLPDAKGILTIPTERFGVNRGSPPNSGLLCLWDADAGRPVASYLSDDDRFGYCKVSHTGRWIALIDHGLRLLDLMDGHCTYLRQGPDDDAIGSFFGPDDRWLAVWVRGRWQRFTVPDLVPADAITDGKVMADVLAPDGGAMVTADPAEWPLLLRVSDTTTGHQIGRVRLPQNWERMELTLSTGGRVLKGEAVVGERGCEVICWDVETGRELIHEPSVLAVLSRDGRTLVDIDMPQAFPTRKYELVGWDVETGSKRFTREISVSEGQGNNLVSLSPDGRTVLVLSTLDRYASVRSWADRVGLRWPLHDVKEEGATIYMTDTGRPLGFIAGKKFLWSADGRRLAAVDSDREVRVWDIPPRKPLAWFALVPGILLLPIAWLARRRIGRVRREVA